MRQARKIFLSCPFYGTIILAKVRIRTATTQFERTGKMMKKASEIQVNGKSEHPEGVFPAVKKNGQVYYRASLTFRRKHISLGSADTALTAHDIYREGVRLLNDTSVTILAYRKSSPLAFDKWVCLINFRDSGIYIKTPIYLGQKQFLYYLSPHRILKFDIDDLFYYSSHKIMCRGGHYFVADYGMQVNIASRYGIKNYAVEGVDYRFINGDSMDFRRENIEIRNRYHGVRMQYKNGQYRYTVRIHVNGYLHVGTYCEELEAAIAYNKAIDILKKNGITKNFLPNYIEGISPSRYAEIYTSVAVSDRIQAYRPIIFPNNQ